MNFVKRPAVHTALRMRMGSSQPQGFYSGSVVGFSVGVAVAGAVAYQHITTEYSQLNQELVVKLQESMKSKAAIEESIRQHAGRLDTLFETACRKGELNETRALLLAKLDTLHVQVLESMLHRSADPTK